jgi:nitrite reductase (NO-forming)
MVSRRRPLVCASPPAGVGLDAARMSPSSIRTGTLVRIRMHPGAPVRSSSHDRLWITVTLIVLSWFTLIALGAFLIVGQGSTTRTAAGSGPQAAAANLPTEVTVTASEFRFNPNSLQLPAGRKVSVRLYNSGTVEHDFTIDALGVKISTAAGKTAAGDFTVDKPGTYDFYCSIPGHKEAGMRGTLSVVGAAVAAPEAGPAAMAAYPVSSDIHAQGIAAAQATPAPRPVPDGTRQGDFYVQGDRALLGLRQFDMTKMLAEQPDYVVFNGHMGALTGDGALRAKVGESVRIFFGVGGPNLTSSFHIIGEIFDRVFTEGSLTNEPATDVQMTHVPAGGATVVEFTPQVPGTYTLVDHSLERLEKGGAGQLIVEGPDNPEILQVVKRGSGGGGH